MPSISNSTRFAGKLNMFLFVAIIMSISSCASTGSKLARVSLGMTKGDVVDIMGTPDSVKAEGNVEVLVYAVDKLMSMEVYNYAGEYWITLRDGKVSQYGKPGDFGNTRNPTLDLNIKNR